ncbi:unnamed protein product [Adineta steineri]|uniref:Uncharacterized protein n=1 Tax=Adineta steineri TaxID=433720 RepID=A0A819T8P2_9BILA|nr:unnamed protein product [Adineta steineri]CAF0939248.1 unnamed protein product [Adineta steineri]CAF4050529.1 unnamed protein product [Adineta steineri]CAF4075664.1 unnamed protein product [Adineta steineri]
MNRIRNSRAIPTVTTTTSSSTTSTTEEKTTTVARTTTTTATPTTTRRKMRTNSTHFKWIQNGITVAGGNGIGNKSYQLNRPNGIYIDDDDDNDDEPTIYICEESIPRVVKWKYGEKKGEVVAGQYGYGSRANQLKTPSDIVIDKRKESLIICDSGTRRVVKWFLRNKTYHQIFISDISCSGIAMDNNGGLYVSDFRNDEVRRWREEESNGILVAGGNGKGNGLNQLSGPAYLFVDQDHSIYISDSFNNRVMKWIKGAKEGIVVASTQDPENILTRLNAPQGVFVDQLGNIFVASYRDERIMRWPKGSEEGSIVVGGNKYGSESNQLYGPKGLSFDRQGNIYVADYLNHRVQRFDVADD